MWLWVAYNSVLCLGDRGISKNWFEIPTMSQMSDTNVSDDHQTDAANDVTVDPTPETGRIWSLYAIYMLSRYIL